MSRARPRSPSRRRCRSGRTLTEAFDALVVEVRTAADSRRAAAQARMAEVAGTQRLVLTAAHGIGILLVVGSLLLALRALRR